MLTDPVADMLTRIRNAAQARLTRVSMPASRMRSGIAQLLKDQGFIRNYSSSDDPKKPVLTLELRYGRDSRPMIERIERVSRPGRRVYVRWADVPKVRNGLGIAILSTPRGILTDQQARDAHVGGEVLAQIW